MAKRFNIYLDDETESLFNSMINEANKQRANDILVHNKRGGTLLKFKEVGNSEIIQTLIKQAFMNNRNNIKDTLEKLYRDVEFYEIKMKQLNGEHFKNKFRNEAESIINNITRK